MNKYIPLFLLLLYQSVFAQTHIQGGVINGDIWIKSGSPYIIQGNINVDNLTIEAGVEVLFDSDFDFQIDGVLYCHGFYSDSITFTYNSTWNGLTFKNCSVPSELNYCRIEGSSNFGIEVDDGESPILNNCNIMNNQTNGLELIKTKIKIYNSKISNNNNGIYLNDAQIWIYSTIISLNSGDGILASDNRDSTRVINSVIAYNSGNGIISVGGYLFVTNSIIYDNTFEIFSDTSNTTVVYSDVGDIPVYPGIGNINDDPLFIDADKYFLTNLSPCIDEGDSSASYNDIYFPPSKGGITNDMGAYGGPLAGNWFPPLYIQPDSLNFGRVSRDDSSLTLSLNINNYRDTTISIQSVEFFGNDSSVFFTDTDSLNIDVLDSSDINITFTPNDNILFSVTIEIETKKYGVFYIPVTGEGIAPEISIPHSDLEFGIVDLGSSNELDVQIINSGNDTLRLFNISTTNSVFTVSDSLLKINPGTIWDSLSVTFTPGSIDTLTDSLIILTNDSDEGRIAIPLFGQGFGPLINLDLSVYNFGSVFLTYDTTITVQINNNGNDTLFVDSIQVANNDSNTFRLINDTLTFIEPGSSYPLEIGFEPITMGIDSAELRILSDDAFNPIIIRPLFGNGVAPVIGLNKTNINFGLIPFNTSAVDSIVIKNSGNYDLIIDEDSLTFSGTDPEFFGFDNISSNPINAGDSALLFISFDSDSEGIKQAILQIVSNDPFNSMEYVTLTGESWAPNMSISDTALNFGEVIKDSIRFLSTTIYNSGQGVLILDSLTITGSESNNFMIDSVDTFIIDSSDSSNVKIQFNADSAEANQAILNIFSNDPDSNYISIDLTAFVLVPFINFEDTSIDFGSIPLNTKIGKSFTIYNIGYDELTLFYDSLEIVGTGTQFFSIDSVIGDTIIQQDDSLQLLLSYSADSAGTKNATLKIRSDDQVLPEALVSLTGSSASPEISLSGENIDFGTIPATADTTKTLKIKNIGTGDLILYKDGFELTGSDTLSFNVPSLNSDTTILPQDSILIDIELNTNDVGPKSAQLKIESNDFSSPTKIVDLTGLVIDNIPASVSLDISHSSGELTHHQNGNLRFNVSTNFLTDSVELNYRLGGTELFQSEQCTDLQQMNLWEITIDSSWITSKGFEYFVRVYHGWTFTDWPLKPVSLQVNFDNVEFPLMTQKEVYQKISIPFNTFNQSLNTLFSDNLGSYDNTKYRIFDCENGVDYTEITNLNKELPPGKSLWLITKDEVVLDFDNAKTVRTDTTFKISLQPGWNMVANPFAFPINWDDNDPNHELRFYDGTNTWPVVSVMEPFKGYAVKDSFASEIFLEPNEYTGSTNLNKQTVFDEYNWTINIKVEQNKLQDNFNIAGSKNNALDGIDKYDYEEPPPIGNYVGLYFLQKNNITGKTEKYSTDIKSESSEGYIYDFEVIGNISGKKSLMVESNSLPEEYNYVVVNTQSKIKYQSDNIVLYSNANKLQLMVGTEEFINSHITEYNIVPSAFKLEQNYPNPFNPVTNIKYELPYFSKLSINVYNVLGQKVRALLNNIEKEAGYYQINWDGRNEFGNSVATGLYILNFSSDQYTKSIKMILQK